MEEFYTKKNYATERFSGGDDKDYYVEGGTPQKPSRKPTWLRVLINILLFIWMLPQELAGILVACFTGWNYKGIIGGVMYFTKNGTGCVSLGHFVFVTHKAFMHSESTCAHEWGHTRQSRLLGPLYLIVIGLPSAIKCKFESDPTRYHAFYTERWADEISKRFPVDEWVEVKMRNT